MIRFVLTRLCLLAGLGAAAFTLLSYFGGAHWLLDLMAHFRVQYAVALLVCLLVVGWSTLARKHLILPIFGLAFLANAIAIAPYYLPRPATTETADLRVLSMNVNAGNPDFEGIVERIESSSADIVLIVEVIPELAAHLEQIERYPYSVSASRSGFFGMVMLSKKPLLEAEILGGGEEVVLGGTEELPTILAMIDVGGQPVKIIGMHAYPPFNGPSSEFRDGQLAHVAQLARDSAEPFILLGDLNATPWSVPMRKIFAETNLTDSAKGFGIQASWMRRNPLFGIPIDHVLVSAEFTTINHTVGADIGSDHFPITVDLALQR